MGHGQGRQSLPHLFHGPGHSALGLHTVNATGGEMRQHRGTPVLGVVGGLPLQSTLQARNLWEPPEPSAWPATLAPRYSLAPQAPLAPLAPVAPVAAWPTPLPTPGAAPSPFTVGVHLFWPRR